LCHTHEQAVEVKARLAAWLAPKGLAFNEGKTHVVHLDDGFDFLGYNVRRYHGKLLIKPSKAAVRQLRERLTAEVRARNGANATAVISRRNPIIRGWSADYRNAVSSRTFSVLDDHVWRRTYRWAVRAHPNKPKTGSSTGPSASSTRPGRIAGSSATAPADATSRSSPGPRSSATSWSQAGHHLMTRPWLTTGPDGNAGSTSRWGSPTCACSRRNRDAAPAVEDCCCTPSTSRKARTTGSNGSPLPARRSNGTP
jgi:RNA-directed DNA polymerase